MGLQRNLSKQIDQPNRQKKILESLMRDDVEEKADEFQQVEAIFDVFGEKLYYFYLVLFDVGQDGLDGIFLNERAVVLILEGDDMVDGDFA